MKDALIGLIAYLGIFTAVLLVWYMAVVVFFVAVELVDVHFGEELRRDDER